MVEVEDAWYLVMVEERTCPHGLMLLYHVADAEDVALQSEVGSADAADAGEWVVEGGNYPEYLVNNCSYLEQKYFEWA